MDIDYQFVAVAIAIASAFGGALWKLFKDQQYKEKRLTIVETKLTQHEIECGKKHEELTRKVSKIEDKLDDVGTHVAEIAGYLRNK